MTGFGKFFGRDPVESLGSMSDRVPRAHEAERETGGSLHLRMAGAEQREELGAHVGSIGSKDPRLDSYV
jgi:hypothetical protein